MILYLHLATNRVICGSHETMRPPGAPMGRADPMRGFRGIESRNACARFVPRQIKSRRKTGRFDSPEGIEGYCATGYATV